MQYSSSFENYSSKRESPEKMNGNGYMYKKSSYQYSTSGSSGNKPIRYNSPDKNIDQLDALLEDLKNERHMTREKDISSTTSVPLENFEAYGKITNSSKSVKTTTLPVENDSYIVSDYSTIKTQKSLPRNDVDYQKYDETLASQSHYTSNIKNKMYEQSRTISSLKPTGTVTVEDIQTDLKNIALSDDILPLPGTKVTTTVRTYTYEIPAGTTSNMNTLTRNQNLLYQRNEQNLSTEIKPTPIERSPSATIYSSETYSKINREAAQPIDLNSRYEIHENIQTTNNLSHNDVVPRRSEYRVKTTENTHTFTDSGKQLPPIDINKYPSNHAPGMVTNNYIYKESSNVINTVQSPNYNPQTPVNNYKPPTQITEYTINRSTGYPPNSPNVTYHYSSSTSQSSTRGPDYPSSNTNLTPAPFPVEGNTYPVSHASPPKKVDELMNSLGNPDAVDKSEIETIQRKKREIETAVASPTQIQVPSVNRAGKEVYYPPGHGAMLQKREEMSASSAAGGGRWAKGSGMYEYESGYKSKTTTKSGGAMVPVCLPLCCAMPCSIM